MDLFDKEILSSISAEDIQVPDHVHSRIDQALDALPQKISKQHTSYLPRMIASLAACLILVFLVILPNVSVVYAQAMENIPGIGTLVEVFTIRNYFYSDGNHELDAEIPAVNDPGHASAGDLINKNVDELTSDIIQKFYRDLEICNYEGCGSINIDYETITNSDEWFTLKLSVCEIVASSNNYSRFYHIDRTNGNYVTFEDLFDSKDFPAIEELLLAQMEAQMAADKNIVYWTEDANIGQKNFALEPDQNFYFNADGDLVIAYNKYEIGPGSMGCPEFTIPFADIQPYLRYSINK